MTPAKRVLARYLEAFAKYDPIYPKVQKAQKQIAKLKANYAFAHKVFVNEVNRKIPMFRPQQSAKHQEDMRVKLEKCMSVLSMFFQVFADITDDAGKWLNSGGKDKSEAFEAWQKFARARQALQKEADEAVREQAGGKAPIGQFDVPSEYYVNEAAAAFERFEREVEYAARQAILPGKVGPAASPEDAFKAYLTRDIVSMAQACAKKLQGKIAPCAALGLDVMEDSNAHSEQAKVQGMLDHYVKETTEEDYEDVWSLKSKVVSAIGWDVIQAGAFLVAILQVVRAPEAGRVFSTLAEAYASLIKD